MNFGGRVVGEKGEDEPGAGVVLFTKAEYKEEQVHGRTLCKCVVWVPVAIRAFVPQAAGRVGLSRPMVVSRGEHPEAFRVETLPGERGEEPGQTPRGIYVKRRSNS